MSEVDSWWETFFSGLIVDFWRAASAPSTQRDADLFQQRLGISPGDRVLDVPCGDGRLAVELASRGYELTGVDISEDFLAAARQSARARGVDVVWRHSDMRDLPWEGAFDAALCGGSSFGFLGEPGDAEFLAAVARALKPGGVFALDAIKAAEVILPAFRNHFETEVGEFRFSAENTYDPVTGWTRNSYTIERGDVRQTRLAFHRIYTCRQVVQMLEAAGFTECTLSESLAGEPFHFGSPSLAVTATKRGS